MSDHEQQVLSAMLTSSIAIDDATRILTGSAFVSPRHELIFDAIVAQSSEGQPVDVPAISDRLGADLGRAGGMAYLFELAGIGALASACDYHAEKVRDAHMVRKVHEVGTRLEAMTAADGDALALVNAARTELDAMADAAVETDDSHESAVYEAIESLSRPLGVKTAWKAVSDVIGGWAPGMLYVAGARPGVGKTVLGIGALLDICRRGQTGVMFSLEMPQEELYLRMLASVGSIDNGKITHRALTMDDEQRMAEAAAHVTKLPMVVEDRSNTSLAQIRAVVRATQRKATVGLVIVDYLGLVAPPPASLRQDRRVQVDEIAQGLKNLARDLRVPVLALAQLNRAIEGRQIKAPTLSDLRESGGIEAAADVVILMHRNLNELDGEDHRLELAFAKNRHGPTSSFHLHFEGRFSRATDPLTSTHFNHGKSARCDPHPIIGKSTSTPTPT